MALHLVNAGAAQARVVLAPRAVHATASEVGAVPAVRQVLAREGCSVTSDAMGTHPSHAQASVDAEADDARAQGQAARLTASWDHRDVLQVLAS